MRDRGVTVIGGFHSPMERECLDLLLRGGQPVVICPARTLVGMRLPPEWKAPLAGGRLLLLSPFAEQDRRITADLARARNDLVAAIADRIFIAYAEPGGKTEAFAKTVRDWGKPPIPRTFTYLICRGNAHRFKRQMLLFRQSGSAFKPTRPNQQIL